MFDRQFNVTEIAAGTLGEPISITMRVPATLEHFWMGMFYTCDGCDPVDANSPQMLRVHIGDQKIEQRSRVEEVPLLCTNDTPDACSNKELSDRTKFLAAKIDKLNYDLNESARENLKSEREMDDNPTATDAEKVEKKRSAQFFYNSLLDMKRREYIDGYKDDAIRYRSSLIKRGPPGSGNNSLIQTYENPTSAWEFHQVAEDLRNLAAGLPR